MITRRLRRWWRSYRFRQFVRAHFLDDDIRPCLIARGRVGFFVGDTFLCSECGQLAPVVDTGNEKDWLSLHDCDW